MKARLSKKLLNTLEQVLTVPTAPFHERWLRDHLLKRFAGNERLRCEVDRAGNLLVQYRPRGRGKAKVCFQAHLDHPGFVLRSWHSGEGIVDAFGGIPNNIKGARLRFYSDPKSRGVPAEIVAVAPHPKFKSHGAVHSIHVRSNRPIPDGAIGMWNQPPLRVRGSWLDGRAFDDNLGSAILTYVIEECVRRRTREPLDFLFTRAEEVGYVGTLELLKKKSFTLPPVTVTIEMPRAAGDLVAGEGVMVRAGDMNLGFDSKLTAYMEWIARKLSKSSPTFRYQRRLGMFGGTESGVLYLNGFRAGCLCLPVVNGHNIDFANRGRPTTERVHSGDLASLITLVMELASKPWRIEEATKRLRRGMIKNSARLRKYLYR